MAFPFLILSDSIYYGTQSEMRVKSYSHLNLLSSSIYNFEHLDILQDSTGNPNKKVLPFDFAQFFYF